VASVLEDLKSIHVQKAELAANESNRASVVALNAEIRRIKARLLEEVPKLQRLAQKRVCFFHQFCFDVITFSLALIKDVTYCWLFCDCIAHDVA